MNEFYWLQRGRTISKVTYKLPSILDLQLRDDFEKTIKTSINHAGYYLPSNAAVHRVRLRQTNDL
jgi:hypothetical protein